MRVVAFERAIAVFQLPYDEKLVGNPDTGVLHGGAITALLDACSGASVFAALTEWSSIATSAGTFMLGTKTGGPK